jgi:hypothetical protein
MSLMKKRKEAWNNWCGGREEKYDGASGERPNSCSGVGHRPPADIGTVCGNEAKLWIAEGNPHSGDTIYLATNFFASVGGYPKKTRLTSFMAGWMNQAYREIGVFRVRRLQGLPDFVILGRLDLRFFPSAFQRKEHNSARNEELCLDTDIIPYRGHDMIHIGTVIELDGHQL